MAEEDTWLFFSAGHSASPAAGANRSTHDLTGGIDHSCGLLGVTFEVEQWGKKDEVGSFDYRGSVYVHGERFKLGLERERRDIDPTFSIPGPLGQMIPRTTGVIGEGTGIYFFADLTDWWRVYSFKAALIAASRWWRIALPSSGPCAVAASGFVSTLRAALNARCKRARCG